MDTFSSPNRYKLYLFFSLLCAFTSIADEKFSFGGLDYVLCFLLIAITLITKAIVIPKRFLLCFLSYLTVVCINAHLSPYTTGVQFVLIGTLITIIPFLVFFISYNSTFSIKQINNLIDSWIYFILTLCGVAFIETFIFSTGAYSQDAILKIYLIKPGFFASICNQGLILSLYRLATSKQTKFKKIAIIFSLCALLSLQLKVICGLFIILVMYYFYLSNVKKTKVIKSLFAIGLISIVSISSIPMLYDKIIKYINLYGATDAYENIARPALYYQSFNIANDFFPFGSGQGTFGSVPVNIRYSKVYYDYNLNDIHGLGETGDNFKMDTHWASIIGENGLLGTILYLILYLYPIFYLKQLKNSSFSKPVKFLILTVLIITTIESLTLCIPGRMAFIFIYAGILGLFCRHIANGFFINQ